MNEVQERNIKAIKNVLERYCDKNIVIGTHGTALSTIINYYNPSYGYQEFKAIKLVMPLIVKLTFNGMVCDKIEKVDMLCGDRHVASDKFKHK